MSLEEDSGKPKRIKTPRLPRRCQDCADGSGSNLARIYPPASKGRSGSLPRAHSSRHAFFDLAAGLMIAAVQCELSVPPACLSKSWGSIGCCMQHGTRILSRAKTAKAIRN